MTDEEVIAVADELTRIAVAVEVGVTDEPDVLALGAGSLAHAGQSGAPAVNLATRAP
jgi:hypothetical protein